MRSPHKRITHLHHYLKRDKINVRLSKNGQFIFNFENQVYTVDGMCIFVINLVYSICIVGTVQVIVVVSMKYYDEKPDQLLM